MEYGEWMEDVARGFEVVGILIIAVGGAYGLVRAAWQTAGPMAYYKQARRNFGLPLILGLEVLVAADIIETITVDRTLEGAAGLGLIVLVRVVLSFSLDIEVDGIAPWRRARFEAAQGGVDE